MMSNAPAKKRALSQIDTPEMESLLVPKELIAPLKGLIDKMIKHLDNQGPKLDIGQLKNIGGSQNDIEEQTKVAFSVYKDLKDKLHTNLKKFKREEVVADLPADEFQKFKELRKNLTQWFRLGEACTKRALDDSRSTHKVISCKIRVSPSIMCPDLKAKIIDKINGTCDAIEEDVQVKLIDDLLVKSSEMGDEFDAVTAKVDLLTWAKAFRATLANGDGKNRSRSFKHSTPNTSKSVSFQNHSLDSNTNFRSKKGKSILKKHFNKHQESRQVTSESDESSSSSWDERPPKKHQKKRFRKH